MVIYRRETERVCEIMKKIRGEEVEGTSRGYADHCGFLRNQDEPGRGGTIAGMQGLASDNLKKCK